jgi:archaellum biogenesis protein FlaJ (TadC family)
MQYSSSKLTLSTLLNEFLNASYIGLAIFLSISFIYLVNIFLLKIVNVYSHNDPLKSRKSFEKKKKKQMRETI